MEDAARVLPAVALFLWLVPLLWASPDADMPASTVLVYVFLSWLALSLAAGVVIRILGRNAESFAGRDTGAGRARADHRAAAPPGEAR